MQVADKVQIESASVNKLVATSSAAIYDAVSASSRETAAAGTHSRGKYRQKALHSRIRKAATSADKRLRLVREICSTHRVDSSERHQAALVRR